MKKTQKINTVISLVDGLEMSSQEIERLRSELEDMQEAVAEGELYASCSVDKTLYQLSEKTGVPVMR